MYLELWKKSFSKHDYEKIENGVDFPTSQQMITISIIDE